MKQVKEQHIDLNGQNIFVKTMGQGDPLIFLHGGPGDEHRYFLPHVEPLAEHFTLIFYDQAGCGQSAPAAEYSMAQEVEILEALRQTFALPKINLLGQSWGTVLGLLYATTYPEHVNKLMLVSTIGASGEGFTRFGQELRRRMAPGDAQHLEKLEADENARVEDMLQLLDPYYVHQQDNLKKKTKTDINLTINAAISEDLLHHYDVRENLAALKDIPTLVLQGKADLFTPQMVEHDVLGELPQAQFIIFPRSGHWPFLEEPQKFNEVTHAFFRNTTSLHEKEQECETTVKFPSHTKG